MVVVDQEDAGDDRGPTGIRESPDDEDHVDDVIVLGELIQEVWSPKRLNFQTVWLEQQNKNETTHQMIWDNKLQHNLITCDIETTT